MDATAREERARLRPPTWRDLLVAGAWGVLAAALLLPASSLPGAREAAAWAEVPVRLAPSELRLAGSLALPVALAALGRRLRRPDDALAPVDRHRLQAAVNVGAMVIGAVVAGPGGGLAASLVASAGAGPLLLGAPGLRGLARGARQFAHAFGFLIVSGFAAVFALLLLMLPFALLGDGGPPPAAAMPWLACAALTWGLVMAVVGAHLAAAAVDDGPG